MSIPNVDSDYLDGVTPSDVQDDPDFTIPDSSASREERRNLFSYLNGGKKDDEKPTRGRPRKRRKAASRPKQGAFVEPLTQMYALAGVSLMPFDQHCAGVILQNAEKCAAAMDELAYQNESVRRVLDTLVTGSAIGAVVVAHMPIIAAVAMHHGSKLPFIPTVVPDVDESE